MTTNTSIDTNNKNTTPVNTSTPITREEMIAYLTAFSEASKKFYVDKAKEFTDVYTTQTKLLSEAIDKMTLKYDNVTNAIKGHGDMLKMLNDNFVVGANSLLEKYTESNSTATRLENAFTDYIISNREAINKMTEIAGGQKETMDIISNAIESEQRAAKSKVDPIFYSTIAAKKRQSWIHKVQGEISNVSITQNIDEPLVYKKLYSDMKVDGYDVTALFEKYKKIDKNATKMFDMIVCSDVLRNNMAKHILRYQNDGFKARAAAKARGNFKEMDSIMKKYFGASCNSGRRYQAIYSIMGIDRDKYMEYARNKYHLSKYAKMSDALHYDKDMLKKFEEAVIKFAAR